MVKLSQNDFILTSRLWKRCENVNPSSVAVYDIIVWDNFHLVKF